MEKIRHKKSGKIFEVKEYFNKKVETCFIEVKSRFDFFAFEIRYADFERVEENYIVKPWN